VVHDAAAARMPEVTLHLHQRGQGSGTAVRATAVAAPQGSGPCSWRGSTSWRRAAPVHAKRRQVRRARLEQVRAALAESDLDPHLI
jgi:hypothetical protein